MRFLLFTIHCSLLTLLIGCSDNVNVSGKVVFSDGTPVSKGKAVFENEKYLYSGQIQSDGSFTLGVLKDGEGIPPGKYRVGIADAVQLDFAQQGQPPKMTYLVADKFRLPKSSGLEYDITGKTTGIEIVVEKPALNNDKRRPK